MTMHELGDDRTRGRGSGRMSRRAALRGGAAGGLVVVSAGVATRTLAQSTPAATPPIVERWAAALNAKSPEQFAALFTDDGIHEDLAFELTSRGQQEIAAFITATLTGAPDSRVALDYAFQDGDRAAALWTWSGTYTGQFAPELPPTGRAFAVPIVSLFELEGELIRRLGDYYSLTTWLRQVGLSGEPDGPPGDSSAATPTA